ncbi:hypothetical protein Dsin_019114 [Dipteronia sinensis]|uniref:DUF659 domain-containing protein n=1 Tax=Dipteronia sinensis TaxID=43782 RepID=A0AAE0A804_9ROSI|nr:hypothetical protein Dsin_019114 [Dipteronia sinensis]
MWLLFSKQPGNEHGKGHVPPKDANEAWHLVTIDVGRFFFENGIPINVVTSPSFSSMCRSLGDYGRGYKVPSCYHLSTWVFQKEVETTNTIVDGVKKTWKTTGVTIMSDGWTDIRGKSLLNFLVDNPEGTIFLKTIDASSMVKDADLIFHSIDDVVN